MKYMKVVGFLCLVGMSHNGFGYDQAALWYFKGHKKLDEKAYNAELSEEVRNKWRDLSEADLAGKDFTGADLTGANLTGANLTGADLTNTKLNKAVLIGTKLIQTKLAKADLTGADLTDADLTGAKFNILTLLKDANLKNAIFKGVKNCNTLGKFETCTDVTRKFLKDNYKALNTNTVIDIK